MDKALFEKKRLKAVLIDDNENALISLRLLLQKYCPQIDIVGESMESEEGVRLLQITKPDVVFLDIELTDDTGFGILEKAQPFNFQVIFVTAFKQYSIKAIRFSATDYLLKPVAVSELISSVERASQKIIELKGMQVQSEDAIIDDNSIKDLIIPDKNIYKTIPVKSILLLEAHGSYTNILLINKETIMCSKNLRYFQDLLEEEGFHRVHRKHLISLAYVREIMTESGQLIVILETGLKIAVSVRERKKLQQRLEDLKLHGI
ncbi:MAG: two-component system LytT family response regulator [Flavobacteriales bacterium]|jgi:two-component system LytT family response regulator